MTQFASAHYSTGAESRNRSYLSMETRIFLVNEEKLRSLRGPVQPSSTAQHMDHLAKRIFGAHKDMSNALSINALLPRQRITAYDAYDHCENHIDQARMPRRPPRPPALVVDDIVDASLQMIDCVVNLLPGKQPRARKILEHQSKRISVDLAIIWLVTQRNILDGSNVISLLKSTTANQDPKGNKRDELQDFFFASQTMNTPSDLSLMVNDVSFRQEITQPLQDGVYNEA